MSYKGLDRVNFGHIAAEDEDVNLLTQYFVETEEYSEVVSDKKKILITGRKGSGKSAIYVALRDNLHSQSKKVEVEALTLQDYPWEIHKRVKDTGASKEHMYIHSWKYVILVLLAKKLVGYSQPAQYKLFDSFWWKNLFDANRRYLKRFLSQTYGNLAPSFVEILVDRAGQIRSLKIKDVGIETHREEGAFELLSRSINVANKDLLSRILKVLPNGKRFYLLFDQLDLGWDDSLDTKLLLTGLILAARDVMREVNIVGKEVQVIIFLRSDIYEKLSFEDKNKLSPNVTELKWQEDRLQELIAKRIQVSAGGSWGDVFSDAQMRSRQAQLSYMVKRTMLRPRDMIQFCSSALAEAKKQGASLIDNEHIYSAERPYSDYMRKEIQDESKALNYPIDELFGVLRELRLDVFGRDDFLEICDQKQIENGELALQMLIDLSVLGVYRTGGRGGGSTVMFRYEAEPWEKLEPSPKLRVHPALKYILGLTEPRG